MGDKQTAFDKEIPEPDFYERLDNALVALEDDLKMINKQSNWTGSFYTDLDAEVYIKTKTKNKRKVSSLLKALNNKSGRAFLVLGEPGGGKSVALRKLAIDLIPQVKEANKIPLYINLKEWNNTKWSESNPPSESQLLDFVRENIARRDLALSIFVDNYFDRLIEKKRFFFIFDSFDEIPQVMNVDDNSILIQQLSSVLYKFIKDNNNQPTGLVSSRHFRKPTSDFNATSEIEIRPFSGSQISKSIRKMSNSSEELINKIFTVRTDLYLTAKNPFMSSMISKYIEIHGDLPKNRLDMFSVFIDDALNNSSRKLNELSMDKEYILDASKKIAVSMFSDFGLEASVNDLKQKFPEIRIDKLIECLKFSRLIRASSSDEGRVSFVHRRFCEYFVVLDMLDNESEIPFQEIPKDSQWRDALVLYCEVADAKKAKEIADNCWSIVKADNGKGDLVAIHCIRFLRDAFKSRHDCIAHIQDQIQVFIERELDSKKPVHWNKFVIELLCLCKIGVIESSVIHTLKIKDSWLCSTAVESCRHLSKVSKELKVELGGYLDDKNDLYFIKTLQSNLFNFGISEAFSSVKRYLVFRTIEITLFCLIFFLFILIEPIFTISLLLLYFIQVLFIFGLSYLTSMNIVNDDNKGVEVFKLRLPVLNKSSDNKNRVVNSSFNFNFLDMFFNGIKYIKTSIAFLPIFSVALYVILYFSTNINDINSKILEIPLEDFNYYFISAIYFMCVFSFLKLNMSTGAKPIDFYLILFLVVVFIGIGFTVSLISEYDFLFKEIIPYLSVIFLIIFVFTVIINIRKHYAVRRKYKRIIPSKLTSREAIYEAILSLGNHDVYINKLIDRIELNVSHVDGEWPSKNILCADSGTYASKLCQLDVRWLGID
ncbi:hypothetical protein N779_09175 [Vibrio coralliilyticus OCN008]|nr:hypothetical protein N779_09175 [Vibrio coralliilyticus OCN008]